MAFAGIAASGLAQSNPAVPKTDAAQATGDSGPSIEVATIKPHDPNSP
jgi:hypothetical protein